VSEGEFSTEEDEWEPDWEEIVNPQSLWFDPYWYEREDMPEDDPWYELCGDFLLGEVYIQNYARSNRFELPKSYTYSAMKFLSNLKFYAKPGTKRRIHLALTELTNIHFQIKDNFTYRRMDEDFTKLWGQYQKEIGFIQGVKGFLKTSETAGEAGKAATSVDSLRIWYARWVLYYMEKDNVKRPIADQSLGKLLHEIYENKRTAPEELPHDWPSKLLQEEEVTSCSLAGHEDKKEVKLIKVLKTTYTRNISLDKVKNWAQKIPENNKDIPPVGEEHYPHKNQDA